MSHSSHKTTLVAMLAHHYDELVDSVRRRFGDRHSASEVVHDVCVQLLEAPEKEGVRTPLALLRKITHDRAVSHYRSERRRLSWIEGDTELSTVLCSAATPDQRYESADELERLVTAIQDLPPRCQEVFVMHKVHELTQQEVAAQLGISLKAVEKHLKVGMQRCRAWLGYQGAQS